MALSDILPPVTLEDPEEGLRRRLRARNGLQLQPTGDLDRGLQSGIQQLGATGRSLLAQGAAAVGADQFAEEQLTSAAEASARAQQLAPRIVEADKVESVGDAIDFAQGQIGQQLPNLVPTVLGAFLGRGAGRALGGATGAATGTVAGSVAAGTGLESGQIFQDLAADPEARKTHSLQDLAGTAAGFGLAAGTIDALPVARVFDKFGVGRAGREALREGLVKRAAKGAATNAVTEGATEGVQTAIERSAHKFVNDHFEVFGEGGRREILNAVVGGAVLGGALGPLEGLATPRTPIEERMAKLQADDEISAARSKAQVDALRDIPELTGQLDAFDTARADHRGEIDGLAANYDRVIGARRDPLAIIRSHVKQEHLADLDAPALDAISKLATGDLELTPQIRELLAPRFHYFDEMVDQVRGLYGLKPESVEIEGTQSGVDVATGEQADELTKPTIGEDGTLVRPTETQAPRAARYRFQGDLDGAASLETTNVIHGGDYLDTSTRRELQRLRDDDPNTEYDLVPLDEAVRDRLRRTGFEGDLGAELGRRGQARFEQALTKLTNPEKRARLQALFDPANPGAFLKHFEVIREQGLPEIAQQGDEDVLTLEDTKADAGSKRKAIFGERARDGGLYDGQFLVQDGKTQRAVAAPRLVRRMLQKQGVKDLDNPTLAQITSAWAGGIHALSKRGMKVAKKLADHSTVAYAGSKRVLYSDIKTAGQGRLETRAAGLVAQEGRVGSQQQTQDTLMKAGKVSEEAGVKRIQDLGATYKKVHAQRVQTEKDLAEAKALRKRATELEIEIGAAEQQLVQDLAALLPKTAARVAKAIEDRNRSGFTTRLHEALDAIEDRADPKNSEDRYTRAARVLGSYLSASRQLHVRLDALAKKLEKTGVIYTSPRLEGFKEGNAEFSEAKRGEEKGQQNIAVEVSEGVQATAARMDPRSTDARDSAVEGGGVKEFTGRGELDPTPPRRHVTSDAKLAAVRKLAARRDAVETLIGVAAYTEGTFAKVLAETKRMLGNGVEVELKRAGVKTRDQLADWLDRQRAEIISTSMDLIDSTEGRLDQDGVDAVVGNYHRVLHASPHYFKRFSTGFLGSGEGAQVYGWGLYFTDSEEVLEFYHKQFRGARYRVDLAPTQDQYLDLDKTLPEQSAVVQAAIKELAPNLFGLDAEGLYNYFAALRENLARRKEVQEELLVPDPDYPLLDRHRTKLEKDLRDVNNALRDVDELNSAVANEEAFLAAVARLVHPGTKMARAIAAFAGAPSGQGVYHKLVGVFGSAEAASKALLGKGVRGSRYLDGFSRSGGRGTSNYVIFDADDATIEEQFSRDSGELSLEDLLDNDLAQAWDTAIDLAGVAQLDARFAELQKTIDGWAKALGMEDLGIRLVKPSEMRTFGEEFAGENISTLLNRMRTGSLNGVYYAGANVIMLSPFADPKRASETLAHEFGHAIFSNELMTHFASADPKDVARAEAVVGDFWAWRRKYGHGDTKIEVVEASKKAFLAAGRAMGMPGGPLSKLSAEDREYALDFDEWFADQIARALTREGNPQTLVEEFFDALMAKIKEFLALITGKDQFLPARSVAEFVQAMYHERRLDAMKERTRPSEAELRDALWARAADAFERGDGNMRGMLDRLSYATKGAEYNRKRLSAAVTNLSTGTVEGRYSREAASAGGSQQHAPFTEQTRLKIKGAITSWLKPEERRALGRVFSSPHVLRQLRAALKPYPAVLDRVERDPLEALSYGYQLWMAGQIDLGPKTQNLFQSFHDFIEGLFGLVSDGKEAENVLRALSQNIDTGARDPLLNILEGPTKKGRIQRAARFANRAYKDVHHFFGKLFYTASSRMYHTGNPALRRLAELVQPRAGSEGAKQGMLEARRERIGRFMSRRAEIMDGVDEETKREALRLLQNPEAGSQNAKALEARDEVRALLRDVFQYMKSKGVELGDLGTDYFPWVFDQKALMEDGGTFVQLLSQDKYKTKLAEIAADWSTPKHKVEPGQVPGMILEHLTESAGVADSHLTRSAALTRTPYMGALNPRNLDWIRTLGDERDMTELAKFFTQDLDAVLVNYVHQGVKRAEFTARFGTPPATKDEHMGAALTQLGLVSFEAAGGREKAKALIRAMRYGRVGAGKVADVMALTRTIDAAEQAATVELGRHLDAMMTPDARLQETFAQARELGATDEDMLFADHYMEAVMGTLGARTNERLTRLFGGEVKPGEVINPKLRLGMSAAMVAQNMAVLGLATFTSLADPVGVFVRSGSLAAGFAGLKAGAKEMIAAAKGEKTELSTLAGALGAIETSALTEALEWEYGSTYLTPGLKWGNELFFRTIGLTQWTRITRLMALAGAKEFLKKHASGDFNQHSKRYLDQLGLKEGDVVIESGELEVLTRAEREAASPEERARDDRVRNALNRFVDESILRPNATVRPIWASDPHWMLIWHLKSFTYSFYETILKRSFNEIGEGNLGPAMMLSLFVPGMMAADLLRELFTEGELDDDKGLGDRITLAVHRSGLTGLKQFLLEAQQDVKFGGLGYESFAGPSVAMLRRLPDLFGDDSEQRWDAFSGQLPYQNVWKHWIEGRQERRDAAFLAGYEPGAYEHGLRVVN